ncbi:MAG: AAA family ATPase [Candidatus Electrothrix communis]|nr:MAG: AAA family ATPase [Candidatus Electrothrix communis]
MKKLPIGKQDFKGLIEGDFLYVDKTQYLVTLAESSVPIFLSRPRRFGKSLMVNTFKELFMGSKELFKDTYAYDNWDFEQVNPVIRLDLSKVNGDDPHIVSEKLLELIYNAAEHIGIEIRETPYPDIAFDRLIQKAGKKTPVVILIDEYDNPILNNLKNPRLDEIKIILSGFYKMIKANEEFIRFLFITGISKFTHVGIFSTLNHLKDITLSKEYAGVLGYTANDIEVYFPEQVKSVKEIHGFSESIFWKKLTHYYNGYSWDGEAFVYNPFSILLFFDSMGKFTPYWMGTGSPSFIINYAKDKKFDITDFEQVEVLDSFLSTSEIDTASPESFLTQAGYLTIKKCKEESYILDFPNQEVRRSFCELILKSQYMIQDSDLLLVKPALQEALNGKDVTKIIEQFKIIYSSIPYMYFDSNKNEHFYSALLLMYLQALGFDTVPERVGNKGRLDLSLHYKNTVYIFELKVDSATKAIKQIIDKNYAGAYQNKEVILVGIQIDFTERNIKKYSVKKNEP